MLEKMGKSKDWVVWCRSREKDDSAKQRPCEVDGKEIFSNCSKQAKPEAREKTQRKEAKGSPTVSAVETVVATGQQQMRSERRVCLVLGSPRLPYGSLAKSSLEELSIRRKTQTSKVVERERTRLLDGHRDRHAWRLWVSGPSNGR